MTQSDAPNEEREEKQRIEKDAIEYENKNPYDAIHSAYFMGAMIEHNKLRDQLSKEREALSVEKHLVRVYKKQAETAHEAKEKERKMRKELVEGISKFVHHWRIYFNSPKVGQPPNLSDLESLISKASELDKNKT